MQPTRATAERYKVTNRRDPAENVCGGARYLCYLFIICSTSSAKTDPSLSGNPGVCTQGIAVSMDRICGHESLTGVLPAPHNPPGTHCFLSFSSISRSASAQSSGSKPGAKLRFSAL